MWTAAARTIPILKQPAIPSLLRDTKAIERLAQKNQGLLAKIKGFIQSFVQKVRDAFNGVDAVHEEARVMMQELAEEFQQKWDFALEEAVETAQAGVRENAELKAEVTEQYSPRTHKKNDFLSDEEMGPGLRAIIEQSRNKGKNRNAPIEMYSEEEYNRYGWARVHGVIPTPGANRRFKELVRTVKKDGVHTADGLYIIDTGEEFGVGNVLVVTDANADDPSVERVYVVNLDNENELERVRNRIYGDEQKFGSRAFETVGDYFGNELVMAYTKESFADYQELRSSYGSQDKGVGRKTSRSTGSERENRSRLPGGTEEVTDSPHSDALTIASQIEFTDDTQNSLRSMTEDYNTYRQMLLSHGSTREAETQDSLREQTGETALSVYEQYRAVSTQLMQAIEHKTKATRAMTDSGELDHVMELLESNPEEGAKAYRSLLQKYGMETDRVGELQKQANELYKRYEELQADESANEEARAIEKSGKTPAEYHRAEAVKAFGYTPMFVDAGYLLPNGKMLNFSGEKGKHFGMRGDDHRAIGQVFANMSGSEAMVAFMLEGNIRLMAEAPGMDISSAVEPTAQQYTTIRKFVREYSDQEYMDSYLLKYQTAYQASFRKNSVTWAGMTNEEKLEVMRKAHSEAHAAAKKWYLQQPGVQK